MSAPSGSPTIAENIRALSRAQKSKAGAPFYSRIINRPAGRVLAAVAHRPVASHSRFGRGDRAATHVRLCPRRR